jgi:multiple antibiotic resistance protein
MNDLILFTTTTLLGFFSILDPIGNVPVFMSLVDKFDKKTKNRVALISVLVSFIIVTIFTISGKFIFKMFGITLPAFQLTGGFLVIIVGYQLLHGRESTIHVPDKEEHKHRHKAFDIAISPLAIPMLAGPGTISTAINFSSSNEGYIYTTITLASLAVISLFTYFCFIASDALMRIVRPQIMKVITRLMGLIISVIGVQMVLLGIKNAIELYSK